IRILPWSSAYYLGVEGRFLEDVVALAPDGGSFTIHEGPSDLTIVRLDANGEPVQDYVGAGVSRVPLASTFNLGGVYVASDGSLVLGGGRDLIRVDATGRVDLTFGDNGRTRVPFVNDSVCAG